ncbi:NEW3 domain-containing protein [Longimicrobium terrae]|uniref:Alpha-galactosidase NEW3 domain-containing protein n=1 Tax=Longimicrobium terrae TaxID=1639882 RepID=A0A841GWV6_9BACT|nr:NEW3 domain-containing protein [Longimicrobium terrae]MBB4635441.1 hypothetical protein [Longimicrobium terrae]MBB6069835.1 hypothetical protein [Longimicrobium terrae]NNC30960.1 hypothetical protein [Longimicrobium terrae]NNC32754.1 hypothetical protein [Longimicrobium terrae]
MNPFRPIVLTLGLCALLPCAAEAQRARVERRGPVRTEATPGQAITLPFRVTNVSGGSALLAGQPSLPAGWRATTGDPRELAAGEAELRLVGVRIPASAAAGTHAVRYTVAGSVDSVLVVVAQRRSVIVAPEGAAPMVVGGDEYAVRFRLSNRGNVAERVTLAVRGDRNITPRAETGTVDLAPGAEQVVVIRGATPRGGPSSLRHQVSLTAASGAPSATARTMVTIVPRGGRVRGGRRLPVELRLLTSDSLNGAGVAIAAAGPLDAAGRVRLALDARTADPAGTPYARRDEARMRLDAPGMALRLGDDFYSLSRLTEPGTYGFGGAGSVRRGWLSAGGMAVRDRRGEGRPGAAGGYLRAGSDRARAGVNAVSADGRAVRWTVDAALRVNAALNAELEAAPAMANAAAPPRAGRLWGAGRMYSYELLHVRGAIPAPGGGSRDQDAASLVLRPGAGLSLSGSVRRGRDGFWITDTDSLTAFRTTRRASLAWGRRLSLEYRDAAADTASYGDVRSVRGRIGVPILHRNWIHATYERGEAVPLAGLRATPFQIAGMQSIMALRDGTYVSATIQRRDGGIGLLANQREWSASLSANAPIMAGTWLRISADARRADGRPRDSRVTLSLERVLGGGHRVAMRGVADSRTDGRWTRGGVLEYALPIGIPLPSSGTQGVVARVVDPATEAGIPDVVVRLGDRLAVTDRNGFVGFGDVPDGEHALRVEPGAGPERVADRDLPILVAVQGGRAEPVQVALQTAGRVTGVVTQVGPDSVAMPMANVLLELTGPGGVRHARTGGDGRFDTGALRPGWWRVRVAPSSLPRHHAASAEQIVSVQPGSSEPVRFRVFERERPVQMIQSGDLTLP